MRGGQERTNDKRDVFNFPIVSFLFILYMSAFQQHLSSIWPRTNYYLRWIVRWIMTGSHVTETDMTGSDISHVSCLEVCSADAQPEVAQYLPYWGLRTGSNFSHVTDGKRPCPEVCSAHVQFSPAFVFFVVVQ